MSPARGGGKLSLLGKDRKGLIFIQTDPDGWRWGLPQLPYQAELRVHQPEVARAEIVQGDPLGMPGQLASWVVRG